MTSPNLMTDKISHVSTAGRVPKRWGLPGRAQSHRPVPGRVGRESGPLSFIHKMLCFFVYKTARINSMGFSKKFLEYICYRNESHEWQVTGCNYLLNQYRFPVALSTVLSHMFCLELADVGREEAVVGCSGAHDITPLGVLNTLTLSSVFPAMSSCRGASTLAIASLAFVGNVLSMNRSVYPSCEVRGAAAPP